MAVVRPPTRTRTMTAAATTASATWGTWVVGLIDASAPGRSRRRPIARAVRPTPASKATSTPRTATTAPARTAVAKPEEAATEATDARGAVDEARPAGPRTASAITASTA